MSVLYVFRFIDTYIIQLCRLYGVEWDDIISDEQVKFGAKRLWAI